MKYPTDDKDAILTDKEAIEAMMIDKMLDESLENLEMTCGDKYEQVTIDLRPLLERQIKKLADMGYHIGLPDSIEWALNSGDGTYRP